MEKIEKLPYPSKRELKSYLEKKGEARSDRTIDRAIEALRDQFGIEISYDQRNNGYYIDKENSLNPDVFYRFLEQGKTLALLQTSASQPKEILKCIHFEEQGNFKGLEYLQPVIEAILNNQKLSFYHAAFDKPKALHYRVDPLLLKEYQNRWYILCIPEGKTHFRFFGIDRIFELEVLLETFTIESDLKPKKVFEDRIGISQPNGEMEVVELTCDPFQGNYLKTLPIHQSQKIVADNDEELRIQLFVEPNFELKRKILELTDCVKVTQPKWLAEDIQSTLQKALGKYGM